jgi:hypothetical protein
MLVLRREALIALAATFASDVLRLSVSAFTPARDRR